MEKKNHLFKAEIKEMLDLVVNSLYSKKEIFLRELISNASDAIDRAKYLGLTQPELVADNPEWKIQILADKDAKTLMISDNGSGMNAEDLEKNLGVIASSGTKAFRAALKERGGSNLPERIGQFGVFLCIERGYRCIVCNDFRNIRYFLCIIRNLLLSLY